MSDLAIFFAGEGPNEIGAVDSDGTAREGVLQALVRKVRPSGWRSVGKLLWKDLRTIKAGDPGRGDRLNVKRLALLASERGQVLVFCRDRDNLKEREREIEQAIAELESDLASPAIVGGCAVECLEGWILALHGQGKTEKMRKATVQAEYAKVADPKRTRPMVEAVDAADIGPPDDQANHGEVPKDATSLNLWLTRAKRHLGAP